MDANPPPLPWRKLWRKFVLSPLWKNPVDARIATWLICMADDEGTVVTSAAEIQRECGFSRQQVRAALQRLEATTFATSKTTTSPTNKPH
jgi:hypothetical protein